jgi:hypothetical protein
LSASRVQAEEGASEMDDRREQVTRGEISVWRRDDGVWGVSFHPHEGDPDYPGVTYTPTDELRPSDFPSDYDPEALMAWAKARWSGPSPR